MYKALGHLGILIFLLPVVNITERIDDESQSLETCFSYLGSLIMSEGMSLSTLDNKSIFSILPDPEVRSYLLNHCIFYHNRTGIWNHPNYDVNETIIREFEAKYPPPDILREFFLRE
jgi:hypothetical protein